MSCHDKVRARTCVLGLCSCPGISISLHLKKIPPFAGADAEEDPLWVVWRMVGGGRECGRVTTEDPGFFLSSHSLEGLKSDQAS